MLIGLHGHAGAGKDTAAALLADHGYRRAAFADKVRAAALALDPIVVIDGSRTGMRLRPLVTAHGWDKLKRRVPEVRDLLDRMGCDVGREIFGERAWIDLLFRDLPLEHTVITDVRAENEADEIHRRGGVVVRVTRRGVEAPSAHAIHRALPATCIDYNLPNDDDLDELRARVDHLVWWVSNHPRRTA